MFPRAQLEILDAIIEPTLSRDVLQLARIDKPALLRRLFVLGCAYSGQILSYQKMIGQLQDAGNTTTLAHYLELLAAAWMLTGLDKFAGDAARSRAGSPKLQVLNTALLAAQRAEDFGAARKDGELWGRLVESAVGAHLCNTAPPGMAVTYWRERNHEVDFVLQHGGMVMGVEVKSGRNKGSLAGLERFARSFKAQPGLVVGTGGIPLEKFLERPATEWMASSGRKRVGGGARGKHAPQPGRHRRGANRELCRLRPLPAASPVCAAVCAGACPAPSPWPRYFPGGPPAPSVCAPIRADRCASGRR